jgi:hypothetical protein
MFWSPQVPSLPSDALKYTNMDHWAEDQLNLGMPVHKFNCEAAARTGQVAVISTLQASPPATGSSLAAQDPEVSLLQINVLTVNSDCSVPSGKRKSFTYPDRE